jgi:hypothetical protein
MYCLLTKRKKGKNVVGIFERTRVSCKKKALLEFNASFSKKITRFDLPLLINN